MAETLPTRTITLKNGDEITAYPLTRGKRVEAMENLKRININPSVGEMTFLNGLRMEQEIASVCFAGWKRMRPDGTLVDTTAKERREGVEQNEGIVAAVMTVANELLEEVKKQFEVETKNSSG